MLAGVFMRFTIRELVLVTAIVALAVGWWVDRSQVASAKRAFENDARAMSRYFDANRSPYFDDAQRMQEYFQKYHGIPASSAP
jgi:hypothetical protein